MGRKLNLYKFFDRIGVAVFLFIFLNSLYHLNAGDRAWDIYAYLAIGLGGLLVDGFLVFFYKEEGNK